MWVGYAESLSLLLGKLWWDKKSTFWKANTHVLRTLVSFLTWNRKKLFTVSLRFVSHFFCDRRWTTIHMQISISVLNHLVLVFLECYHTGQDIIITSVFTCVHTHWSAGICSSPPPPSSNDGHSETTRGCLKPITQRAQVGPLKISYHKATITAFDSCLRRDPDIELCLCLFMPW